MLVDDPRVQRGMQLLRERAWYDAHGAFEVVWLEAEGDERRFLQGLIHAAVALEHLRRENPRGALSQWGKARQKLVDVDTVGRGLGIAPWLDALASFYARIDLEARDTAQRDGVAADTLPPRSEWPVPE